MKSDPIQGIIFQEKTIEPVHPVARLRRSVKRLPGLIQDMHRPKVVNPDAPIRRTDATAVHDRMRNLPN